VAGEVSNRVLRGVLVGVLDMHLARHPSERDATRDRHLMARLVSGVTPVDGSALPIEVVVMRHALAEVRRAMPDDPSARQWERAVSTFAGTRVTTPHPSRSAGCGVGRAA
jgi:hypothetical protein